MLHDMSTMKSTVGISKPVRVGLIGVGGHARQILIPAMQQVPEKLQPVILATARPDTARQMGERYRLPFCVGHEALLKNPDVEAVIIASHDHEKHAIDALQAGKHVFTETPGITTRSGAESIRKLTRESGLVYQVGSCLRYAPVYQKLLSLLTESRGRHPGPRTFGVRYYPYVGHFHNLLLYLGGDMTRVLSVVHPDNSSATSLFKFVSGDVANITWCSFHNVSLAYESVEILHPSGRMIVEDGRALRVDLTPPDRAVHPYAMGFNTAEAQVFQSTFSIPYGQNEQLYLRGYTPELEDFVRCIREKGKPLCGVDDAEKTMLVGQAVGRSTAAGGQWETL